MQLRFSHPSPQLVWGIQCPPKPPPRPLMPSDLAELQEIEAYLARRRAEAQEQAAEAKARKAIRKAEKLQKIIEWRASQKHRSLVNRELQELVFDRPADSEARTGSLQARGGPRFQQWQKKTKDMCGL